MLQMCLQNNKCDFKKFSLVVALLATSGIVYADLDPVEDESSAAINTEKNPCNPLSVQTCGLPFPSNYYSQPDAGSPTGIRINIPDAVMPALALEEFPEKLKPASIMTNLTGYSALAPVLFEVPSEFDNDSLPTNGGNALQVYDLDTGKRMAIRAAENMPTAERGTDSSSHVIEGYPRSRWPFGHTMVAVLTKSLNKNNGDDFSPSAGVVAALESADPTYQEVISLLDKHGVEKDEILSFTSFTVRDEASVTAPFLSMLDAVAAENHEVEIASKTFFPNGDFAALVQGTVKVANFRQDDGRIDYRPDAEYKDQWINFSLMLPRQALTQSVPVFIYGHGIIANKETGVLAANQLLARGVAVIAIDQPYHGSRIEEERYFINLFNPDDALKVTGAVGQSAFDFYSLFLAIKNSLNTLDILPGGSIFWALNAKYAAGKGVPDLDVDQVYYIGTSLGGLFGASFCAVAPDLKGAFLEVAGAGVGNTLSHTDFYRHLKMGDMFPQSLTGAESALMLNLAVHQVDYADGLNYAHYFRNPPAGIAPKPLALQYGLDDQIVFNGASVALAEVAGLEMLEPYTKPLNFLGMTIPTYDEGFGLLQSASITNDFFVANSNIITDTQSHLTFIGKKKVEGLDEWVDQVVYGIFPSDEEEENDDAGEEPAPIDPGPIVDDDEPRDPLDTQPSPNETPVVVVPAPVTAPVIVPQTSVASSGSGGSTSWGILLALLLFTVVRRGRPPCLPFVSSSHYFTQSGQPLAPTIIL